MYFASRLQAGRMLASQLVEKYRYENCAVVALDDGGVVVGAQIAAQLHAVLMMLMTAEIHLPMEPEAFAGISENGSFSFNDGSYTAGEIEELSSEYFRFIEQEKMAKKGELGRLVGAGGLIDKHLLRGRNIILVSDGLKSAFTLDIAMDYLKPIASESIIVATPLASVQAIDKIHILADGINCLSVVENYMDTDHYYDQHDVPEHDKIIEIIEKIILAWK